jgi:hypothetical protein
MNQYRALSGRVRYLSANLPQRVTAGPQLSEFFISRPHDSDISTRMNIAIGEPGLATLLVMTTYLRLPQISGIKRKDIRT